ncbi:MAG: EAL domain-containing protein [Betaproteobacteria bacterium]
MNDTVQFAAALSAHSAPHTATHEGMQHAAIAERVRLQQAALFEIMKSGVLAQDLKAVCERLTEITAHTLGVGRVSVWLLAQGGTSLDLTDLFESPDRAHVTGLSIQSVRYPAYFEALKASRTICANDAQRDPRTREFCDDYLQAQHIHSMLDATIWRAGESHGVVRIESVNERRMWTPDEQQFAGSIADLVMLAFENDARRLAQRRLSASEERFSQVFRLSPDWMVITRLADGIVLEVNASFESQSGYGADEVVGRTTRDFGLWAIPAQRELWLARGAAEGSVRGMEVDLRLKSGDIRTFQVSTERIAMGGADCLISISRDITENKRHERMVFEIAQGVAAATGETFFRSLVERLLQALDADTAFVGELAEDDPTRIRTIAVQQRGGAGDSFAYSLDGSPCEQILGYGVCAYPSDVAKLFPRDKALMEKGIQGYVGAPLVDSTGCAMGLIAVLFKRPIEESELAVQLLRIFATRASAELERRNQLAELEYRATHDLLTGLLNRAALEKQIDSAIRDNPAGAPGALLLVDLDRFKEINDTLGHTVGDSLLVKIGRRLASENDAGSMCRGRVARFGGDEFAIWLERVDDPPIGERVASRALSAITAPFDIEGYRLEVGASIGIAQYPEHGNNASDLLRCADIAMYVAKRQGSGYAVYRAAEDPYSPKRLTLMSQLGEAVRGGQLELHYQPRMNLARHSPSGFEALVRWRHPQLGLLPPAQFIPLAELSDVIRPLTLWVLDEALGRLQAWSQAGRSLHMAVNLSARHLMDDACPVQVQRLLDKHGVDPQRLELEITESAIIADPERATHTLQRIHEMGVKISIDDFGTGYSSLSHLKRLPLNALKIDVSFVTHMLANEQDAVIVESTIALAHNLGLSVVAEGIEDARTEARLRELGCDEGQGYLFGRPMAAAETFAWLETRATPARTAA